MASSASSQIRIALLEERLKFMEASFENERNMRHTAEAQRDLWAERYHQLTQSVVELKRDGLEPPGAPAPGYAAASTAPDSRDDNTLSEEIMDAIEQRSATPGVKSQQMKEARRMLRGLAKTGVTGEDAEKRVVEAILKGEELE